MRILNRSDSGHAGDMPGEENAGAFGARASQPQRRESGDRGCEFHRVPETDSQEPLRPARGILTGLLISLAFWLSVGGLLLIWLRHGHAF